MWASADVARPLTASVTRQPSTIFPSTESQSTRSLGYCPLHPQR
jgi:hypothetical protein